MSTTKTYADLGPDSGTGVPIGKCSGLLPNHMQCWRSGDFQVTETISTTTEDGTIIENVTPYQLCRRHELIQKEADIQQIPLQQAEIKVIEKEPNIPEELG